ncbi:XrtA/PEP-CTERM system TPR-repeat protein PrsT [Paraglaciecola sp.]|uniref:XrtA/PEP-CTERM system TPR-repeat protein PrsT n=1 Tax=Paraglaciecola sp. TaxID=1920173 RepID=UPI0030F3EECB
MNKTMPTLIKSGLFGLGVSLLVSCGPKTADEYIAQAQQFVIEKNSPAAIVALKNAVQVEPKSADARYELGKTYFEARQYDSAEKELNRAFEYGYDPAKVLPLLTQAYKQTGAYSALSKIEHKQAGLTSVEQAEIGYFKVLSLVRLEKFEEARLLISELAAIDSSSIYKGLTAAYVYVLDKNFSTALDLLTELRTQAPQDAEVLKLLAQLHLALNDPQAAADVFKEYVQFYPEDNQISFVLAKLQVDLGHPEEAEPLVDKLLPINPQNPLLNQLKSVARVAQKDFTKALQYAEVAITNGSTDPALRLIAGYSAYQIADYAGANRHISYVAGALPDNHPALKLLAASQLQLGLTNEAGEVLERIDELSAVDAPLLSKASFQLLTEGYEKDARQLVKKSSEISVTAEDLTRLGLLQLSLNNLEGIVNLEEAVEKSPDLVSAQTTLATAYLATGQFDKALDLAIRWKSSRPKEIKAYLLKGEIHLKRKEYVEAEAEFTQAASLDSKALEPPMALIKLGILQQKFEVAAEKMAQLLNTAPDYLPALATNYLLQKKQGQVTQAIDKVKAIQSKQPDNLNLRLLLARIYLAEVKYQDAINVLDGIKDISAMPVSYWKIKGQSLINSNKRSEAEKHYEGWLKAYPNDKDATLGSLLLLDSGNKFADGIKLSKSYLEKRDDVQVQLLLTHFLIMNSEVVAAKKAYDNLPSETYKLPLVKGFLARLQLFDKLPAEALENAKIAYQASPNYRNAIMLVSIYEQLQQADKGEAFLQEHLASHPDDLPSRMLLAERQIGDDTEDAMGSYEYAIQQNPKNFIALNNLAYLHLQKGQLQKAKDYAEKAVELRPNDPATVDTLAQVLVAEKSYEKAIKLYERVVDDKLKIEEIYLNYVEALFLAKQDFLAKRKLEQKPLNEPESIKRIAALKARFQF